MRIARRNILKIACLPALPACITAAKAQGAVRGVSSAEILLGSHQDLSGPVASLGAPFRDGMLLAADEVNRQGGVHGRRIRVLVEDSGFDPKRAVLATQKLIRQDGIFAMVAALGSAPVQASMPAMLAANVPVLFSGTPADFTYLPFHRIKFGLSIPYGEQVKAMVRYCVHNLQKKRIAIFYQDDETGHNVLRAAEEQTKAHGLALVERASYKRGAIDFSSQVARLRAAGADMVLLGSIVRETAGVRVEAKKQGWPVDMMVTNAGANPSVVAIGGDATEGLYAVTQFVPVNAQPMTPALAAVLEHYREMFGKPLEENMVYGYVAMMLFAEGARLAGRALNVDTLVQGLEQVKNFTTAFQSVPVSFAPNERLGARSVIFMRVTGGKYTKSSP